MKQTHRQLLRGTNAQLNAYLGLEGEIAYDTTNKRLRAFDGVTLGGAMFVDQLLQISAGLGLTGGGLLSEDLTITLGNPTSISDTSTNLVSGTTHTHAFEASCLRKVSSAAYAIGCQVMAKPESAAVTYLYTNTIVGANVLRLCDVAGGTGALIAPLATWACLGYSTGGSGTMWVRIA